LRNAPATEREFNVLRTPVDLTFALRVAFPVELNSVFWPAALVEVRAFEALWAAEARVPRELGYAAERDVAGLALT
jgi:hypothetical protein